jgi:hypothetical protein
MWADSLLALERLHLVRLVAWGAGSLVVGLVLWMVVGRRPGAPLPTHFAIQLAVWGTVIGAAAGAAMPSLALRDHSGAVRLGQTAVAIAFLSLLATVAGVTMALAAWLRGRRLGLVGAGLAIMLHGIVLGTLHFLLRRAMVI